MGGRKNEKREARMKMLTMVGSFIALPVDPDLIDTSYAEECVAKLYNGKDPRAAVVASLIIHAKKHWKLVLREEEFTSTNFTLLRLMDLIMRVPHKPEKNSPTFANAMLMRIRNFREFPDPTWHSHLRKIIPGIKTASYDGNAKGCNAAPPLGHVIGENHDHLVFFDTILSLIMEIIGSFKDIGGDDVYIDGIDSVRALYRYI